MTKYLLYLLAALGFALLLALWRIDNVTADRDQAVDVAKQLSGRVDSLRTTLRLQRELANDQAAIEANYLKEKQRAEDDAESLRRCLADGTCGLRVNATCPSVRVDRTGTAAGQPDAGSPRLTAAAEQAYPALVAGLKTQRAQIAALQDELRLLHSKCRLAP